MPPSTLTQHHATLFARIIDRATTQGQGEQPAILAGGATVTYEQLARLVDSCAERLRDEGIGPGDRVVILLPNSAESIIGLLATTAVGAIAVPVIADAGPERIAYVIENTQPVCCLLLDDSSPVAAIDDCPLTLRMRIDQDGPTVTLAGNRKRPASRRQRPTPATADDAAVILFSSGTTGRPKGVLLKHRHLLATASTLAERFGIDGNHRELVLCPMCHSGGWQRVAATLWSGGCVFIPSGLLSVTAILEDIDEHHITGLFSPPPLFRYFLKASPAKVRSRTASLRSIEIGSAFLKADELRALEDLFPTARIFYHYGLTECSRAFILDAREHPDKSHTVGSVSPGVEAAVCDEDGRRVPPGTTGQVWLRGNRKADGYWNRPDLDRVCFQDGWLLTGDYGAVDEDGFLTLLGRKDDMITSAGHHFFPAEVEIELGPVDDIVQYLVAGVPDPRGILGEVPWAFVVPVNAEGWSPQRFLLAARSRLAAHLVPRNVIVVPSLPLTPSGKPDRRQAVALYASSVSKEL